MVIVQKKVIEPKKKSVIVRDEFTGSGTNVTVTKDGSSSSTFVSGRSTALIGEKTDVERVQENKAIAEQIKSQAQAEGVDVSTPARQRGFLSALRERAKEEEQQEQPDPRLQQRGDNVYVSRRASDFVDKPLRYGNVGIGGQVFLGNRPLSSVPSGSLTLREFESLPLEYRGVISQVSFQPPEPKQPSTLTKVGRRLGFIDDPYSEYYRPSFFSNQVRGEKRIGYPRTPELNKAERKILFGRELQNQAGFLFLEGGVSGVTRIPKGASQTRFFSKYTVSKSGKFVKVVTIAETRTPTIRSQLGFKGKQFTESFSLSEDVFRVSGKAIKTARGKTFVLDQPLTRGKPLTVLELKSASKLRRLGDARLRTPLFEKDIGRGIQSTSRIREVARGRFNDRFPIYQFPKALSVSKKITTQKVLGVLSKGENKLLFKGTSTPTTYISKNQVVKRFPLYQTNIQGEIGFKRFPSSIRNFEFVRKVSSQDKILTSLSKSIPSGKKAQISLQTLQRSDDLLLKRNIQRAVTKGVTEQLSRVNYGGEQLSRQVNLGAVPIVRRVEQPTRVTAFPTISVKQQPITTVADISRTSQPTKLSTSSKFKSSLDSKVIPKEASVIREDVVNIPRLRFPQPTVSKKKPIFDTRLTRAIRTPKISKGFPIFPPFAFKTRKGKRTSTKKKKRSRDFSNVVVSEGFVSKQFKFKPIKFKEIRLPKFKTGLEIQRRVIA